MASPTAWHWPFAVIVGGAMQATALIVVQPQVRLLRDVLILGLDRDQWYVVALWVTAMTAMLGLAVASVRLEKAGHGGLAGLSGVAALFGTIGICFVLYIRWIFASDERTELTLADGSSVIVTQFCWHHCTLWVNERDGIFIGDGLVSEGAEDHMYSFDGEYSVAQRGGLLTVTTEQGEFVVRLN